MSEENLHPDVEEKLGRFNKIAVRSLIIAGALAIYFFVYPILLTWLDDERGFNISEKVPEWLYNGIGLSAYPIVFLMEIIQPYEDYIVSLEKFIF